MIAKTDHRRTVILVAARAPVVRAAGLVLVAEGLSSRRGA